MSRFPVPDLPNERDLRRYTMLPPDFICPIRRFPDSGKAQDYVYDAWKVNTPEEKFRLCKKALRVFPFSVDAFNCIADIYRRLWKDSAQAKVAYERSLSCARMLWPDLEEKEEIPWGVLGHRPFLRAYHGLAVTNLELDNTAEAVEQLRFILRVNPSDNQGCRMILFTTLIELGEYKEAKRVAKDESSGRDSTECDFVWGYVVMDFAKYKDGCGDIKAAEESLGDALNTNSFVPQLLLLDRPLPPYPETVSPGSLNEAVAYARSALKSWKKIDNALSWLCEARSRGGPKPPDDGSILFDLLANGKILFSIQQPTGHIKTIEGTTRVSNMHGTALPEFELPAGMKEHNPARIICFDCDWHAATEFTCFPYDSVTHVDFWAILHSCKRWKKEKDQICSLCYGPAGKRCDACKAKWYCSRECQKKHWKENHKFRCKKLTKK